jgi:multidrug resistance efflux pump
LRAATVRQQLTSRNDKVARRDLHASMDGTVNRVLLNTVGGVVKAGETIMEVVPAEDKLLIAARVKPTDIAFIKIGQPAKIRISAYDSSIFGTLAGTVVRVGADAIVDNERKELFRSLPGSRAKLSWLAGRTPDHFTGHGCGCQHQNRQTDNDGLHAQARHQDAR